MITTSTEWKKDYTTDGQWTIHNADRKLAEDNTFNADTWREWKAEIKWKTEGGKLKKAYQLTEYEYRYGDPTDNEGEEAYIDYEIISRRQYRSRNALMNAMRSAK